MKVFDGFNETGDRCPICHTHDNKPCVLIPVRGTEDGGNIQAKPVHEECFNLIRSIVGMEGEVTCW